MADQPASSRRRFSAASRRENLDRLADEEFDLLVVGGGITGVAVARDAAMRDMRTALVEKEDFASGTSGRSSRLIHGGIRYLEYYQFRLVFECCSERRVLRQIAPRLVRPLPFLYPLYRGQKPAPWKLRIGLTLYDALGLFRNVQRHTWLDSIEAHEREPVISQRNLLGAARFYDAKTDDGRLTLTIARSAHLHGAVVVNHTTVVDLITTKGRVAGARVVDQEDGREIEVRARVVVNATGVWSEQVLTMDDKSREGMLQPTQGIHVVIPRQKLCSRHAIVFDSPSDGRHVFLIPWGEFTLIGTTDTEFRGELDTPTATWEEVDYLLEAIDQAFRNAEISRDDIISTFAGLRPLVAKPGLAGQPEQDVDSSYARSRAHEIVESNSGLITIIGGKLTTHRLMAEQAVDQVQQRLAADSASETGRKCCTREKLEHADRRRILPTEVDDDAKRHLLETYGGQAAWILAYAEENPALGERIVPELPYLMAEVVHSIRHEMALTLSDVMMRRTHVIYETRDGGLACARSVAELMGSHLGWDTAEIDRQLSEYASQVEHTQRWRET